MWSDQPSGADERLSDVDRALVHALQVDPRAPWARIAQVLGIDAATVARRWGALVESRNAWLTVACDVPVESRALALVLVPGVPSDAEIEVWCSDASTLTADRTSRGVLLLVHDRTLDALAGRVAALVGTGHTLEFVVDTHLEHERPLDVLGPAQVRALTPPPFDPTDRGRPPRDDTVHDTVLLLTEDVRMSLGAIAQRLDVSDATARRLVERLLGLGLVRLGCDVAAPVLGQRREVVLAWPPSTTLLPPSCSPTPR
ncbi:AsnC family protein [Nocardioides yefusunii]|uniref:AsnC family protein n=1 Tax=Nocardioides yefusunii TaxID=2500546 RepID=UPI000FE35CFD|nr:AsnC family protein [Nocardioides yefusunii]